MNHRIRAFIGEKSFFHSNTMRGNTQARDTKQNILLYIVFAIRHPRRTFQQLLRRDFIELCKGDQNMETWKEKNLCWHQG